MSRSDDQTPLADFLNQSAAQGVQADSGEFTISHKEAWKRLQQSLPEQSFWILKLVQAAVRWKAPRLQIHNESNSIVLEFSACPAEPEQTAENLLCVEFVGRGLQHLRVALAGACADPQFEKVEWTWTGESESYSAIWDAEDCSVKAMPSTGSPGGRLVLHHQGTGWFKSMMGKAPFSDELKALTDRAYCCPIPIMIDGRELELEEPVESDWFRPAHLTTVEGAGDILRMKYFFYRRLQLPAFYDWMADSKVRRKRPPYGCHSAKETCESIAWILDGVVVDRWTREQAETAVGGVFQLSAEGLELDLSGFAIRFDSAAETRWQATRPARRKALEGLLDGNLASVLEHDVAWKRVKRSVWGRYLVIGLIFFPLLLPAFFEVFRLPRNTREALEQDLEFCRLHIEERLRLTDC